MKEKKKGKENPPLVMHICVEYKLIIESHTQYTPMCFGIVKVLEEGQITVGSSRGRN